MSEGRLLPKLDGGNGPEFAAGDVRARENPGLSSLHTIFVREHNRIALNLFYKGVSSSDEELYQMARRQGMMENASHQQIADFHLSMAEQLILKLILIFHIVLSLYVLASELS